MDAARPVEEKALPRAISCQRMPIFLAGTGLNKQSVSSQDRRQGDVEI